MNNEQYTTPLVSVIVLTYNQEQTIGRTIESILAQKTNYPFEIIIGEDASPSDNTRSTCEQYTAQYPQIISLLPKAPNKGVLKNYADCIAMARGRYVGTCAGDDWWSNPHKIQLQVDFMTQNPDYGVVHTNYDTYNQATGQIHLATPRNPPQGDVYCQLFKYSFIAAPTAMYRRDLLDKVDFEGLRTRGIYIEDYPMWMEMSRHTKIGYIDQVTVTYSVLENSLSHSISLEKQLKFIEQIHKIHCFYLEKYPQESISAVQAEVFYKRSVYMTLLQHGAYKRAVKLVSELGFSPLITLALRNQVGCRLCRAVLKSSLYKKIKKL